MLFYLGTQALKFFKSPASSDDFYRKTYYLRLGVLALLLAQEAPSLKTALKFFALFCLSKQLFGREAPVIMSPSVSF